MTDAAACENVDKYTCLSMRGWLILSSGPGPSEVRLLVAGVAFLILSSISLEEQRINSNSQQGRDSPILLIWHTVREKCAPGVFGKSTNDASRCANQRTTPAAPLP